MLDALDTLGIAIGEEGEIELYALAAPSTRSFFFFSSSAKHSTRGIGG